MITEDEIAKSFAAWHAGGPTRIRYAASLKKWLISVDGGRWQFDDTRQVHTLARQFNRRAADQESDSKIARCIASAHMRTAVLDLARDDPMLAASDDEISEALNKGVNGE